MSKQLGMWWDPPAWNPVTGCTPVSAGCDNCWAKRMHGRNLWGKNGKPFSEIQLHYDRLEQPLHWRKPRMVAVCLMGDMFHPDVPTDFIVKVFMAMAMAQHHTFCILTKRPERMAEVCIARPWFAMSVPRADGKRAFTNTYGILPNVLLGTSVEDQATWDSRVPELLKCPAAGRFVSIEPMIGPIDLKRGLCIAWQCSGCQGYFSDPYREMCPDCGKVGYWSGSHAFNPPSSQRGSGIDWLVVGAESGPKARPMKLDWVRDIRDQCLRAGVPLFFKQAKVNGKMVKMPKLDGRVWDQRPEEMIRQVSPRETT